PFHHDKVIRLSISSRRNKMRRLSMKSKKGKTEASDSEAEDSFKDEVSGSNNGDSNSGNESENESATDAKQNSKRKNKRAGKKSNNADAEDGASESKKKKKNLDEPEEAEEYEVDTIVDMKVNRGKRQFKIRWKGYGPDGDSWENEDDLNCAEKIKTFLEEHNGEKEESKNKKRGGKGSNKGAKKKQKSEKNDESEEPEDVTKEFEVDKVMEVHFKKNGTREFLIHWKGFSHKEDTWEPEQNLNCPELIEKFMAKVGKAKSSESRELRANPQHTERFTLNMAQSGRRLSRRNQGKQRATYHGFD
ncbi:hypothetical protein L9F63_010635, partial [Diploptera punctata]